MIPPLERLLGNGLRAPVLITGLATLGIWLVVPVSFALSSHIATAAAASTTYPSSSSRLHHGSSASAGAPATGRSRSAALGEAGPPSGRPGPAAPSGRGRAPARSPAAAPPPRRGLEVVVAVVGVVVAAPVGVIVIAVVVIVVLVGVVVRGVGVASPATPSAPAPDGRRHVWRRVVVIIVIPEGEQREDVSRYAPVRSQPLCTNAHGLKSLGRLKGRGRLHLRLGSLPLGFALLAFLVWRLGKDNLDGLALQLLPVHLLQRLQQAQG